MASFGFQSPLSMPRWKLGSSEPICLSWGSSLLSSPLESGHLPFPITITTGRPCALLMLIYFSPPPTPKHTEVFTVANIKAHSFQPFTFFHSPIEWSETKLSWKPQLKCSFVKWIVSFPRPTWVIKPLIYHQEPRRTGFKSFLCCFLCIPKANYFISLLDYHV